MSRFGHTAVAITAAALLMTGCGSIAAPIDVPPRASQRGQAQQDAAGSAQLALEREIRESGIENLAKSLYTEETIGELFGLVRSMINGKDDAFSPALDRKMEKLADELPKKMAPLMNRVLDLAEAEFKRALREQALGEVPPARPAR